MSNQVERLAIEMKPLAYKSNKQDWIIEGNVLYMAGQLIKHGWIKKSEALNYVEVCVQCWGGYRSDVGPEDCVCKGTGIVLRGEPK